MKAEINDVSITYRHQEPNALKYIILSNIYNMKSVNNFCLKTRDCGYLFDREPLTDIDGVYALYRKIAQDFIMNYMKLCDSQINGTKSYK